MRRRPSTPVALSCALVLALVAAACSGDDGAGAPSTPTVDGADTTDTTDIAGGAVTTEAPVVADTVPPTTAAFDGYVAEITRTEYGVPHVVADDWGSLGFGQGYAFAQDRACTLIDQVIKVRGERSRWFGPGDDDANVLLDVAYRQLGLLDRADERFADTPADLVEFVDGYVAGFDAQLEQEGPSGWCAGEPWVQPITRTDLYAYLSDVTGLASSSVLIGPIGAAQPPSGVVPEVTPDDEAATTPSTLGSNGWAIGSELSATGGGLLLANPHFPWEGELRLWESHLTLTTGELDVYGATLSGVPGVLIGFNDAVAWTHTVSAGNRMTLYELDLVPGDPTSYRYGDTTREMTSVDITIDVLQPDGSLEPVTRTMWHSHYGPMLELPFGWTADTAYTFRDANADNGDVLEQFLGMNRAGDLDEFIDVHRTANGIPWVNTIAVSADGRAWYADTSATPHLSPEAIAGWQASLDEPGSTASLVNANGAVLLDGSDPVNEWIDDPAATRPGILPFDLQPQLERRDFVFNANDSHWLAHPAQPLTGFSPLTGPEGVPQSARTRMNGLILLDEALRGDDGTFDAGELESEIMNPRGLHAEFLLPGVLAACERTTLVLVDERPYDIAPACAVLAAWDRRYTPDSRGAVLFREYLGRFAEAERTDAGALYRVGFDPTDPLHTPNAPNDAVDVEFLRELGVVAKAMTAAGIALDVPLGDVQVDGRIVGDPLGLPGGTNVDGTASIVGCCSGGTSLAPGGERPARDELLSTRGGRYPITTGNSFMMVVEFGPDGPTARAVLTYGQVDDPDDPDFVSQIEVYSAGAFREVRSTPEQIAADPTATTVEVRAER
ncbi:MAG: penicillin acylase family protein [Acidimicrobiales bacterium]|nr:penicillin acylase family protein [Acidimicrobiales bacterium]